MLFTYNNQNYQLILLHVAGSRLYGTYTDKSDWDYRGIFIASNNTKLGFLNKVEQLEGEEVCNTLIEQCGLDIIPSKDFVIYEINRFFELAMECNPNIMDTLFHNKEYVIYENKIGEYVKEHAGMFMSQRAKHTFSGYAFAQLKRIKSHNKWINEFPDTDLIIQALKVEGEAKNIDFYWISDNYGPDIAEKIMERPENRTNPICISYEDFIIKYQDTIPEMTKYRLPRLIDYVNFMDLKGMPIDLTGEYDEGKTYFDLLTTYGSFRTLGHSMLAVYDEGRGLFSADGFLKRNDPEHIGEYIGILKINHNEFKRDRDHVGQMWHWKANRNVDRGSLEDQFGYDTKHASHLARLLSAASYILKHGVFQPTLTGEELKLVKDIRAGVYEYEWVLNYAAEQEKTLDEEYSKSQIRHSIDRVAINDLLLEIINDEI